ncbi:unnamed protein product [Pedinophyceae sp. YPF-701]|nr:unnamed protein product [Pedinophyceae sp. YPF-701]
MLPVAAGHSESDVYKTLESLELTIGNHPDYPFFKLDALVRPCMLEKVLGALVEEGIQGVTVSDVVGMGVQRGSIERYRGSEFGISKLVQKSRIEVVCSRDQVNDAARVIAVSAHTGEIGDGKIFVSPVADMVRIRTGQTGHDAERMTGGRSERIAEAALKAQAEENLERAKENKAMIDF